MPSPEYLQARLDLLEMAFDQLMCSIPCNEPMAVAFSELGARYSSGRKEIEDRLGTPELILPGSLN